MNRLQTIIVVKHLHAVLPTLAAFSGVRVPPDPTAQSATRISESTRGKLGVPLGSWNRKFSVRTGKFTFVGAVKRGATKGVSSNGCVGNMGLSLAPRDEHRSELGFGELEMVKILRSVNQEEKFEDGLS
jgi:hypothetical protein